MDRCHDKDGPGPSLEQIRLLLGPAVSQLSGMPALSSRPAAMTRSEFAMEIANRPRHRAEIDVSTGILGIRLTSGAFHHLMSMPDHASLTWKEQCQLLSNGMNALRKTMQAD